MKTVLTSSYQKWHSFDEREYILANDILLQNVYYETIYKNMSSVLLAIISHFSCFFNYCLI